MTDTVEGIMELARQYAWPKHDGEQDAAEAALRAAVERVIAERDDLALELHEERANSGRVHEALSRAELQLTAAHQLQREHTVQLLRAEAEVARLRQEIGQPLQAERERDALRALLIELTAGRFDANAELLARIDAALKEEK